MARTRNWPPRIVAEVFIRHTDLKHPTTRIAKATGLSYQQVLHFTKTLDAKPCKLPQANWPDEDVMVEIRNGVEAADAKEDAAIEAAWDARRTTRAEQELTPEQREALRNEVEGCIDLVRQVAAQFRISPRHFLWLCTSHARSSV